MIYWLIRKRRRSKPAYLVEHDMWRRVQIFTAYFFMMVLAHVGAMLFFEKMSLSDSLWVTFTTVTTVGYGDLSAQTGLGRIATVVLLYFGGIFVLAKIAGDYFDFRVERKNRMFRGYWRWKMQDHIIIINTPSRNGEQYFIRLLSQFRANPEFKDTPIQLLTRKFPEGLPESLRKLGVVHFTGSPESEESLQAVDAKDAKYIVVLAQDEYLRDSDSLTFDIVFRLKKELDVKGRILAECVEDENRKRLINMGVDTVLRPIRAYPEFIVRSIMEPGTEKVMENLFTFSGMHTRRYDLSFDRTWSDLACALMQNDCGTLMAYLNENGDVICSPAAQEKVSGQGLILAVRETHIPSLSEIQAALTTP